MNEITPIQVKNNTNNFMESNNFNENADNNINSKKYVNVLI